MTSSLHTKNARRKSTSNTEQISNKFKGWAIRAGTTKLVLFATILAATFGALAYYQFVTPQTEENNAVRKTLADRRKQNAIARLIQETRPQFLDEFRRLITNYTTARELLPSEAEISNVLDAVQQMARTNDVRLTLFDASKPGAKSTNPGTVATQPASPLPAAVPPPAAAPAEAPARPIPQISLNERVIPAQIQGTHANVARFLSAVARYPRIIYIRDFSIIALNRAESVNLSLVTYDAPTSGVLPPIPDELRDEFLNQTAQLKP